MFGAFTSSVFGKYNEAHNTPQIWPRFSLYLLTCYVSSEGHIHPCSLRSVITSKSMGPDTCGMQTPNSLHVAANVTGCERRKSLTEVPLSLTVFWDVMFCRLADRYHCLRETSCVHLQGLEGNHLC
jgi:hypothetical protein